MYNKASALHFILKPKISVINVHLTTTYVLDVRERVWLEAEEKTVRVISNIYTYCIKSITNTYLCYICYTQYSLNAITLRFSSFNIQLGMYIYTQYFVVLKILDIISEGKGVAEEFNRQSTHALCIQKTLNLTTVEFQQMFQFLYFKLVGALWQNLFKCSFFVSRRWSQ